MSVPVEYVVVGAIVVAMGLAHRRWRAIVRRSELRCVQPSLLSAPPGWKQLSVQRPGPRGHCRVLTDASQVLVTACHASAVRTRLYSPGSRRVLVTDVRCVVPVRQPGQAKC